MSREVNVGVRLCGALYVAMGVFYIVSAIDFYMTSWDGPLALFDQLFFDLTALLSVFAIGFGVVYGLTGIGLWQGKKMAVGAAMALSALNLLAGGFAAALGGTSAPLALWLWPIGHGLIVGYLALSKDVHASTL